VIWVDDIIISGNSRSRVDDIKKEFCRSFKMEDKGELRRFLGMEIKRQNGVLEVNQAQYTRNLLSKFGMSDCKAVFSPGVEKEVLTKVHCPGVGSAEKAKMQDFDYHGLIGGLVYLSVYTRPDISFSVGVLSQFLENPGLEHWVAAKRVFRYLKGSMECGLTYRRNDRGVVLSGASDADWSGNLDDRRSTSGYCFHIGTTTAAISWRSLKQPVVALSSTEAEYVALAVAAQEAVFLRSLLGELGFQQNEPTEVSEDNQSCISLAKNPGNHKRTKHIDVKYHFLRDLVANRVIRLEYVPSEAMVADLLTKHLGRPKTELFRRQLLGN
jgi:hypothetical protein